MRVRVCILLGLIVALFGITSAATGQGGTWSYTYNFVESDYGFSTAPTTRGGVYVPGVGFEETPCSVGCSEEVSITRTGGFSVFNGATVTQVCMVYNLHIGGWITDRFVRVNETQIYYVANNPGSPGTGIEACGSWTGAITKIEVGLYTGSGSDLDATITGIVIKGTGDPPEVVAEFAANPIAGSAPLTVTFHNLSSGATEYFWNFGDGNTSSSSATFVQHTYTAPATYMVTLVASNTIVNDSAFQLIEVDNEDVISAAASYKPLRSPDEDPEWGMFDFVHNCELDESFVIGAIDLPCDDNIASDHFVNAFAVGQSKDVHAIGAGTVVDIVGPGAVACDGFISGLGNVNYDCHVVVPNGVLNANGQAGWHVYRLDANSMYRVTVSYANQVMIDYYVSSPVVSIGDELTPGCIIGKTLSLYPLLGVDLGQFISFMVFGALGGSDGAVVSAPSVSKSWTGLRAALPDSLERLYPKLVLEPDSLTPCNQDPSFASCAGDPQLLNPSEWTINGGVIWNPGAKPILQPFASLRFANDYFLSSETNYTLTVNARATQPGTAAMTLQVGTTQQAFTLSTQLSSYQIPAQTFQPDLGLFYTVSAANSGTVPLEIVSFCLSEGDVYSQPGSCYFLNPSFDDNLNHWTYNSQVTDWVTSGQVLMNDGGIISQNPGKPLYPNGSSEWEYYVTLRAAVIGDGWESASSSTVSFDWEFPTGGATGTFLSPASTTTYAFSSFKVNVPNNLNTFAGNEILFQAVLPISAVTSGAFSLTANLDLNDDFEGAVLLRELCVNDPLAQWPDDGIGGGIDPPFHPTCTRVSPPTTNDIGAWTWFHWSSLDRFFQCDMMVVMNQISSTTNTTLHYLRWQGLYQQAVAQAWVNWIPQNVIPWLNGHFRNMAVGSVTVVNQPSGGCHDLFCLMDSFFNGTFGLLGPIINLFVSIVTQGAELLFSVITALITIFIALIGQVWTLFSTLGSWLGALANAWNNTVPVVPDFLPNCAVDYTSSAFCLAMFALENTIFSGPGELLVPLVVGFGSIMLLLYVVETIRDLIVNIGKNV